MDGGYVGVTSYPCDIVSRYLGDISWMEGAFATKLGMVACHHKHEECQEKCVDYSLCSGHSDGSCDQNMTLFCIFPTAEHLTTKHGHGGVLHYHEPQCVGMVSFRSRC